MKLVGKPDAGNTVRRSKKTKAIAQSMITPKSMTPSKSKSAALGAVTVVFALAALAARTGREAARTALSQAQDRLKQQKAELRRIEADASTPRPNVADGQVNVARAELAATAAAIGKLTIRAPISGTVLQVNAKPGELAGPSSAQPLLVIGDVSALRVRVELEERDFGEIKIGQPGAPPRFADANSRVRSLSSRRLSSKDASTRGGDAT